MFKHVNKYRPFIKVGMQGMVAYRANFFLQVIAQSLGAFVTYIFGVPFFYPLLTPVSMALAYQK